MKKDELKNTSQDAKRVIMEKKTEIVKRLIDKNIDVFKRLAKK